MVFRLNAKQLRNHQLSNIKPQIEKKEIYIILEDVLDTYNVGAIFRLADAVAIKKIYLCGGTQIPPNPRIKKSSINTTEIVDWEYKETALDAFLDIKRKVPDIQIVAIEQAKNSKPYNEFKFNLPLGLVVGNESYGILSETLKACDSIVELPMFGVNVSLNVMVSLAVVLYHILEKK